MKVKPEHCTKIKEAIESVLANNPNAIENYEAGRFPRSEKVKDLQKRFCFDLLQAADISAWLVSYVYPYCNDDNIYSVLKRVSPTVMRKF